MYQKAAFSKSNRAHGQELVGSGFCWNCRRNQMVTNAPATLVRMEDNVTTKRMISFVNADADILASCARLEFPRVEAIDLHVPIYVASRPISYVMERTTAEMEVMRKTVIVNSHATMDDASPSDMCVIPETTVKIGVTSWQVNVAVIRVKDYIPHHGHLLYIHSCWMLTSTR